MKVFVVVALLVASAAARIVDVDSLRERSLLQNDLMVKENNVFGRKSLLSNWWPRTSVEDVASEYGYNYPMSFGHYGQRTVNVLSFEELISTPLFREYYNIPLFRQFLEQYPVVFQRYLESVLFQQFWTVPQFMQYFRNPVLFYKYIYPQVQVVARTHDRISPISGDYNKVYDYEQYLNNKNVYPEGREVVVGDYLNKIFSGLHHQGQYESLPYTRYGSIYGNNKHSMYSPVNYKFLLDKIYKTLYVNQPRVGDVTEVQTDVKVAPAHKFVVVEPITGETKVVVEEPKIMDVEVKERQVPRSQVATEFQGEHRMVKEVLLKKLLIHKVITPEVYEILETLPLYEIEQLIRERQGIFDFETTPYISRREILRELESYTSRGIFGQRVQTPFYGQQYNRHYNNEIVGERVVPEYYNTVYGQRHIVPTYFHRV